MTETLLSQIAEIKEFSNASLKELEYAKAHYQRGVDMQLSSVEWASKFGEKSAQYVAATKTLNYYEKLNKNPLRSYIAGLINKYIYEKMYNMSYSSVPKSILMQQYGVTEHEYITYTRVCYTDKDYKEEELRWSKLSNDEKQKENWIIQVKIPTIIKRHQRSLKMQQLPKILHEFFPLADVLHFQPHDPLSEFPWI